MYRACFVAYVFADTYTHRHKHRHRHTQTQTQTHTPHTPTNLLPYAHRARESFLDGTSYNQVQTNLKLNHIEYKSDEISELMSLFIMQHTCAKRDAYPHNETGEHHSFVGALEAAERERERACERESESERARE